MTRSSVVVHGHFYQPPRENPWTGHVSREPTAAPYHDWNERIHAECYRAVVAARILDSEGRIARVLNTLEWISWDAGPTLLQWLAREAPDTYRAFLEADFLSRRHFGHGAALATTYHHVILPLTSYREKRAEVRWGITDFRRRFGREPEGFWLPEAAVDSETLEVLAEEGIRFTVLGPGQVSSTPAGGLPGRVALGGSKSIAVFVYDGGLSHEIAFGGLIKDASRWVHRLTQAADGRNLVSMATDGETFGHHHPFGDMGLAATLGQVGQAGLRAENFASFLARHPAREPIEVVEPSSWSCSHGVKRWQGDCGCKIDPSQPTSQAWRAVLRDSLAELGTALHRRFTDEGGKLLRDPWAARDEYGSVLDAGDERLATFLARHLVDPGNESAAGRVVELLEMERDLLRMDTSCGWFFDDVARLEPVQNLRYAAHSLDLAGPGAEVVEQRLVERLGDALSNDPAEGTGADVWRTHVRARLAEDPNPPAHATVLERMVSTALRNPAEETVAAALATLDARPESHRFDAQTAVARAITRSAPVERSLARLAGRMGVAAEPTGAALPAGGPVRFVFGIHLHQPVGNFDWVFKNHVEDVYLPFIERCAERRFLPLALHVSGPLLEWLEHEGHRYLDRVARLTEEGSLELLLAGFYEPVLPALAREDRIEQIGWMREWLATRFGARARGLWLTERVWEPGLARDLADAGVEHVLLDDRHFLVAGHERHQLGRPWRTEAEGRGVTVLPIDERLRYLIPFRSPREIGGYLRELSAAGREVAVLADDGEKFGGWPGTAEWVWGRGWLVSFLDEMERLQEEGIVRMTTPSQAVDEVPSAGLTYLPTASYREMEAWSLPPRAAETLEQARHQLEADPSADGVLRGGHWRGFLAKYVEANRMHKKVQVLSELCRRAGDPVDARRAIGRAQCNDAYWHGVFGGLYLRHLRNAIWSNAAEAERILRSGQAIGAERLDLDQDGAEEIWVHSAAFSAIVRPADGGTVSELSDLARGINLVDVLTRRRESYHRVVEHAKTDSASPEEDAMPSIHKLEEELRLTSLPPVDLDVRALFVDRVLPADVDEGSYIAASYVPAYSWANEAFEADVTADGESITIALEARGVHRLEKILVFSGSGHLEVTYRWDPAALPRGTWFAPELSVSDDPGIVLDPEPSEVWRHEIVTVSKREAGFEETVQGLAITPRWSCALGKARIVIPARRKVLG